MNDLDKLINELIKEKGGTKQQYLHLLNSMSYHETGRTQDPKTKQQPRKGYTSAPGRGLYQLEEGDNKGGITAAKRLNRYLTDKGLDVPEWLSTAVKSKSLDATQYTPEQQSMLTLGYHRGHPKADFSKVWKGEESVGDFWSNYHHVGRNAQAKAAARKDFDTAYTEFSKENPYPVQEVKQIKENPPIQAQDNTRVYKPVQKEMYPSTALNLFADGGNIGDPPIGKGFTQGLKEGLSQSPLNPKNWGVDDYSKEKTFNTAFEKAKSSGDTEFLYNKKRYNTKSDTTPQEEFNRYGVNYKQTSSNNWLRDRIQKNINPNENDYGYDDDNKYDLKPSTIGMLKEVGTDFIKGKRKQNTTVGTDLISQDIFNMYLGKPAVNENKNIKVSSYKPTKSKNENSIYYTKDNVWNDIEKNLDNGKLDNTDKLILNDYNLGDYTVSKGKDDKGDYISYYDKWDLHPGGRSKLNPLNYGEQLGLTKDQSQGIGKPVEFYDRKYYTTNEYGQRIFKDNKKAYGGNLKQSLMGDKFNSFNVGGSHESNPNGGIPLGVGANGRPNTVEQGEASYKFKDGKYIFSDRIKLM